jgi:hypothetical protein
LTSKSIKLLFFSVFFYNFNVLMLKNKNKIIFSPCLIIFNSLVLFYRWKTLVYIQPSPCQVETQLPYKFYEATIFLQSMIRVSCTGSKSPAQSKHWIYDYLWEWLKGSFLFFYFLFFFISYFPPFLGLLWGQGKKGRVYCSTGGQWWRRWALLNISKGLEIWVVKWCRPK